MRTTDEAKNRHRLYNRARNRAQRILATRHAEEYAEIFEGEVKRLKKGRK